MPHTSHKKRNFTDRRMPVDADGWTRVTHNRRPDRSEVHGKTKPAIPDSSHTASVFDPYSDLSPIPPDSEETLDEFVDRNKSRVPGGLNIEHLQKQFSKIEAKWIASESWRTLEHAISKYLAEEGRSGCEITNCVLLGTGTMCGIKDKWITRHDVAILQTVVFKSIVDAIYRAQEVHHHPYPTCYAQEPLYNNLDTAFLAKLNINTVNDPEAFEKITTNSFVYTPGAELHVDMRTMFRQPALFLTAELNWYWRNEQGEARTDRIESCTPEDMTPDELSEIGARQGHENENNCRILEEFKENHECIKIPDFEANDYPFYQQYLYYYRQPGDP